MTTTQDQRNARKFETHRKKDPHCTCPSCLAYHAAHTRFVEAATLPAPPTPDVTVDNHGSIFLFHLHTDAARAWVAEHVPEDATFFGDALVVEPRYAGELATGLQGDGLEVK